MKAWLAPKGTDAALPPKLEKQATNSSTADAAANAPSRPSLDRAVTAALCTPHDAVLAELAGKKRDASPDKAQIGSLERGRTASPGSTTHTSPDGSSTSAELIYDPFSGGLAYVLAPRESEGGTPAGTFEQSKDELWAQLGRIRELQSEIAGMHAHMEGIGTAEGRNLKKGPTRSPTDNILGEEWPEASHEEDDKKRERDADFDHLSKAFEGRHAAIDGIMNKLDELSTALTTFHALPTPTMDFATRNNTKDSVLSSPSPTFTADAGSPQSAHAIPSQLHKELQRLHIPKSGSPDPSPVS